jgi:hypothetical protein
MTRQLPAGTCIRHAVNSVRNNIAYAFRISWPWYAVLVPLSFAMFGLAGLFALGTSSMSPFFLAFLVLALVSLVAFASIAVNWHRYILLDEMPKGREVFRLDDKTWRYFGNLLLILLILVGACLLVMLPLSILAASTNAAEFSVVLIALIILPIAGILSLRLSVKLPAIALGRRDFLLKDAWSVTQANILPLFFIALFQIVFFFGFVLVMLLLQYTIGTASPAIWDIVGTVLQMAVNWIFTIFGITILTSLYGFFVENRDF